MVVEQENKQAYYLCNVKKRDGHTIVNRGNICLKFVTNKAKNKKGFKAKYSQGKLLRASTIFFQFDGRFIIFSPLNLFSCLTT